MGVKSAPRAKGAMTPERAGTERASRGGVSLAWLHTNSEGPHSGTPLLGRTRRPVGGLRSMRSPSDRSQPAGQEKASRSDKEETGRAPAWQNKEPTQWQRSGRPLKARGVKQERLIPLFVQR